jgi:hypothetical protein
MTQKKEQASAAAAAYQKFSLSTAHERMKLDGIGRLCPLIPRV